MKRALLLLALLAKPLAAQGPGFDLGRLFTEPAATSYRLGLSSRITGPLSGGLYGTYIDGDAPLGNLFGMGGDLSLFKGGSPGVYLVGGLAGGMVAQGTEDFWGSWSAGVGFEIFPFKVMTLGVEGRYREVGPGTYHGVELGFRVGFHGSSSVSHSDGSPGPSGPTAAATVTASDLEASGFTPAGANTVASVVQTARDVMGSPYRWGGDGEEGFDCSGLIRYAFGKHGVVLPRRSADQAREGVPIEKSYDAMRPGDILTFSSRSDKGITHVGLYLGNQQFIHSATGGVQISILDPNDAAGRWWYNRWIGVRRVVG